MATLESYRNLRNHLILASKIVGVEIWTAPGKIKPASCIVIVQLFFYFGCNTFTVLKYRSDFIYVLKILITLGPAVQLFMKFVVYFWRVVDIKSYGEEIERELLDPYQTGSPEEVVVLTRAGRLLWRIFRLSVIMLGSTGVAFLLYPIFIYMTQGETVPLFLYEVPYYDLNSVKRYFLNLAFQFQLYVLGMFGLLLSDFVFIMYVMYAMARVNICIVHLRELETMLNDPLLLATEMASVRCKWIQCMDDHRITTGLLNKIEELFGVMCFIQVVMGVFTVCDVLLLVALTDWYPVHMFLVAVFFELSALFVVGHFVELKVDELYDVIISTSWYRLPEEHHKEFGFLLFRQQRPLVLTMYGFAPVNFVSYSSVLKKLYQFFVLVMQYVD
ncbi:putative odorant receptor 83c [Anopheles bellator]|uniref:putative odorant receptor 83c n=1 Tax=Anopheles bellator TaxID=139047 RepID=UPI00264991A2|nr:putative odorant receptor 83c [Anopheles bellator]